MEVNQPPEKQKRDSKNILGQYLASALDLEDHMSYKAYGEYLKRSAWPARLSAEAFSEIKQRINVLIEDTQGHQAALRLLREKL